MAAAIPFILAGSLIGSAAYKMKLAGDKANMENEALELQRKQAEVKAAEDQIKRSDAIMRVEDQQQAEAVHQGMSLASGTLGSLTEGSYNKYAESSQTGKFNLDMRELSIDQKEAAVEAKARAEIFGTLIDTAVKGAELYMGMPPTPDKGADVSTGVMQYTPSSNDFWGSMGKWTEETQPGDYVTEFKAKRGKFSTWLSQNGESW